MEKFQLKVIAALCGPLVLAGCSFFKPTPASVALAPVSNLRPGDPESPVARAYQTGRDYERAAESYRNAIKANPDNAEAHNALGVLYAMQGKTDPAIAELMTAATLAPKAVHIQNNLGFAYLLTGRSLEAVAPLKIAAALDPSNQRIRENLRNAQRRAGVEQPAPARAPETVSEVIAATEVKPVKAAVDVDPNAPTIVTVAPNIFELRNHLPRIAAAPPVPPVAVAAVAPLAALTVNVEVANGNGVTGLAKRTSSILQRRGYVITRLTNQLPYTQKITEIQYRRGQEHQAQQLNALLSVPSNIVESDQLSQAVGVRLVLGRDVAEQPIFADMADRRYGNAGHTVTEAPPSPRS